MPPTSGQTIFATAATTAAFAVALLLFGEWFKWVYRRSQEKRLLLAITADLIRHLQRGIERLDEYIPQVQRAALKPAILHIKKLRVDEKSPVFSDENLRYLEEFYARRVSTLRFRLRNFNMDCDFAVDIYEHGDRQALLRTLEYVRNRNRYVKFQVEQALI